MACGPPPPRPRVRRLLSPAAATEVRRADVYKRQLYNSPFQGAVTGPAITTRELRAARKGKEPHGSQIRCAACYPTSRASFLSPARAEGRGKTLNWDNAGRATD